VQAYLSPIESYVSMETTKKTGALIRFRGWMLKTYGFAVGGERLEGTGG